MFGYYEYSDLICDYLWADSRIKRIEMKKEEISCLKENKLREGKSLEQAYREIKRLKDSQTDFKVMKRTIEKLERQLEKKDNQIEKLQKHNFSLLPATTRKANEIKQSKNDSATIKDLNRILSLLEAEKKIRLGELTKDCGIKPKICKGALNFLIYNKFIRQFEEGRSVFLEIIERRGEKND